MQSSSPVHRLQTPIEQYPLPKVEDLLATLARGREFTNLELTQAYLQLELDQELLHEHGRASTWTLLVLSSTSHF